MFVITAQEDKSDLMDLPFLFAQDLIFRDSDLAATEKAR
jgi:hypothetical protein